MDTAAPETFNIGKAVELMWVGRKVARQGWNGRGMWLAIQKPDEHSMNRQPYVYIVPVGGERIPWVCSQADLLANDWMVVAE